jgi:diadenosine tetraphosphate (Ap4A) HIT family hydrolase
MEIEIFYAINVEESIEQDLIQKCLEVFVKTQFDSIKITRFEKVVPIIDKDTLKTGLIFFTKTYEQRTHNRQTWYFYIGNGDIYDDNQIAHKNVTLLLWNRNPKNKECCYVVNKNKVNVQKNMDKQEKMLNLKTLSKSLRELKTNSKSNIIRYNNIGSSV